MNCILCGVFDATGYCSCKTIYCSNKCRDKDWLQHKFVCVGNDTHLDKDLEWNVKENFTEEYNFNARLGSGTFGTVFLVKNVATEELSALKIIKTESKLMNDATRLRKLSRYPECNPHVSCYYEHFKLQLSVCDPLVYAIRMEYLSGGDLSEFKKRLPLGEQRTYLPPMIDGALHALRYIHSVDIIHADIKPANLAFRSTDPASIVLVDFGLACEDECKNQRGTWLYQGPEVFLPNGVPGKATDVFSIAASLYTLFGPVDWVDTKTRSIDKEALEDAKWDLKWFLESLPSLYGDLLLDMLAWKPRKRPTAQQALNML